MPLFLSTCTMPCKHNDVNSIIKRFRATLSVTQNLLYMDVELSAHGYLGSFVTGYHYVNAGYVDGYHSRGL